MKKFIQGDTLTVLKTLPDESIDCVITSPPYWGLRDYGMDGQIGLEPTFGKYIEKLCNIFDEVKRVLKKEGTIWVNLGDTYMGNSSYSEKGRQGFGNDKIGMMNKKQWLDPKYPHKEKLRAREHIESGQIAEKSLCQIPSRFAIEMSNRGWILRNRLIWHKPNCMPASVTDRFTVDYEDVFFFVKSKKYYFEQQFESLSNTTVKRLEYNWKCRPNAKLASGTIGGMTDKGFNKAVKKMKEKGMRNKRSVWSIPTKAYSEAHFAVYPEKLIEPMIKAGSPKGGIVLDPFLGSGTTALVARNLGRDYLGIDLNKDYIKLAEKRLAQKTLL